MVELIEKPLIHSQKYQAEDLNSSLYFSIVVFKL